MVKKIIELGVGNLVGVGLIGATSGMVNDLPAGTAKNIAGIIPGLQSTALVSHNFGLEKKQKGSNKQKGNKLKW